MLPDGFSKSTVLYIKLGYCPPDVQDQLCDMWEGGDYMKLYGFSKGMNFSLEYFQSYWKDQCDRGKHSGDLPSFIKRYRLQLQWWLMELGIDLSDVNQILITR